MKRRLGKHPKGVALGVLLALLPIVSLIPASSASASKTYEIFSARDSSDGRTHPAYDLSYISVVEWSEFSGDIFFYLIFETQTSQYMFNDGRGSWGGIFIDTNFDGNNDIRIDTSDRTYPLDNTFVPAYASVNGRSSGCTAKTFTNINESAQWIGFKVSKSCLGLPSSFNVQGYADYIENDNLGFDYAPETPMRFDFPSGSTTTTTTTTVPSAQVPNAPSSVAIAATSESSLRISWIDNSSNEDGFLIQRDDLPVTAGTSTATWPYKTAANVATWDVSGLATGKRYCFAISAYNAAGASKFSDFGCIELGTVTSIVGVRAPQLTCDATRGKKGGTTIAIIVQAGTANAGRKLSLEAYVSGRWVNFGSARVTAAGAATLKAKVSVVKTKGVITIRATQGSRFICEGDLRGLAS